MADVLIDSDVFVDHLRGHRPLKLRGDRGHFSSITRAELYAGREQDEGAVETLLAPLTEVPVDRRIAEAAGRMRRRHGIALADAVIAATALERGFTLLTRNVRHFTRVPDLRVRSPG